MKQRDVFDLLLLGALWGASFLFMRMGATDFGAAPLVWVRVAGATALLLPLLLLRGQGAVLMPHWRLVAVMGLMNSALPFLLFTVAAPVLPAGLMAVFNATAPIWGALFAYAWLGEKLGALRWLGLAIGVAGVVGLAWEKLGLKAQLPPGSVGPALAIAACVGATVLYGLSANFTRRYLTGVPPLALAAGSQISATVVLALPAWWWWPATPPSARSWGAAAALAVVCTGLAYLLFFRLIARVGATQAISVTFLIPAFAMLWGWLFLHEAPTGAMLLGCAVILLGTALSTGLLRAPQRKAG
jgi:drug/metabolite transporter (DMT)-like permease